MDKEMSKEEKKSDRFILFTEFIFPVIKEWFKETIKGIKKEPFTCVMLVYLFSYLILWVEFILTPVLQSMEKYSAQDSNFISWRFHNAFTLVYHKLPIMDFSKIHNQTSS